MVEGQIRVKVECLFVDNGRVLAGKGRDRVKGNDFYRVLGGTLNFGEITKDGVRREIREELNCEIENLKLVDVIENIFTYEDKSGHEIVFLYKGELANRDLYNQNPIHITEDGYEFDAEWIPISDVLEKKVILYPEYNYAKVLASGDSALSS